MDGKKLGYAIEKENLDSLYHFGIEPRMLLNAVKEQVPKFNHKADPAAILNVRDQGSIGACQGMSLSKMFQICYFLSTGRIDNFSEMCGYIIAQKYDGLIGRDVGSTLSGGQKAATIHGMCLDTDWPYLKKYSSKIVASKFPFKLASAKPTNDPELIKEAIELGLPVQTGMSWNSELEQEVTTKYTGRGARGGHATTLWLQKENNEYRHLNSWGMWNGDGYSSWTERALEQIVTHRGNTFVIYAPEGMVYPELGVI